MQHRTCSVEGCDWAPRGSQRLKRGLCPTHYEHDRTASSVCREPDCRKQAKASHGWCWGHYERWRKTGDPQGEVVWHQGETTADRLMKKVEWAGDCWHWRGHIASNGYGKGSDGWAHRLVYEALVGPVPDGLELDHLCRVRRCVNPDHLQPVTRKVNLNRSALVGKNSHPRSECKRGHPRTPENVYVYPSGQRDCRPCQRIRRAGKG